MKPALIAACLLLAVAAAAAQEPSEDQKFKWQLMTGLRRFYRRFLRAEDPKQLALIDAFGVTWKDGKMMSEPQVSAFKVTSDGAERSAFSQAYTTVGWGEKPKVFYKQSSSEIIASWHSGATLNVHMITEGGSHKTEQLGNPLATPGAKFTVVVPRNTWAAVENPSDADFAFLSYISVPRWDQETMVWAQEKEMAAKFPDLADAIKGVFQEKFTYGGEKDDDEDEDEEGSQKRRWIKRRWGPGGRRW